MKLTSQVIIRKKIQELKEQLSSLDNVEEQQCFLEDYTINEFKKALNTAYTGGVDHLIFGLSINDRREMFSQMSKVKSESTLLDVTRYKDMEYIVAIFCNFEYLYSVWKLQLPQKHYENINNINYKLDDVRLVYWFLVTHIWRLTFRGGGSGVGLQNLAIMVGRGLMRDSFIEANKNLGDYIFERKLLQKYNLNLGLNLIKLFMQASGNLVKIDSEVDIEQKSSRVSFDFDFFDQKVSPNIALYFVNPSFLPMVLEPVPWDPKTDKGIYRDSAFKSLKEFSVDAEKFQISFVRFNPNLKIVFPNLDVKKRVFSIINKLQKIPLYISKDIVDFLWECRGNEELTFSFIVNRKAIQDARLLYEQRKMSLVNYVKFKPLYKQYKRKQKEQLDKGLQVDPEVTNFLNSEECAQYLLACQQTAKTYHKYQSLCQQYNQQGKDLALLDLFSYFERIWLPWNVDARLRHYPISVINHQKEEFQRACFFSVKKHALDANALSELELYLADLYGEVEKVPYNHFKKLWVETHQMKIIDPLNNKQWLFKAKKPVLFLAACFEYIKGLSFLKEGKVYMSGLLMWIDASVNALQNFNAIVKNASLAPLLNMSENYLLRPEEKKVILKTSWGHEVEYNLPLRMDLYESFLILVKDQLVKLIAKLDKEKKNSQANRFRHFLESGLLQRSLVKTPIMSFAYGVTKIGIFEQLAEELDSLAVLDKSLLLSQDYFLLANSVMLPIMNKRLEVFLKYMLVLQLGVQRGINNKKQLFEDGLTEVIWKVPILGCEIVSLYKDLLKGTLDINILGKRMQTTFYYVRDTWDYRNKSKEGENLKVKKEETLSYFSTTARSISPNFIHSLDATIMLLFIEKLKQEIIALPIHDSIGIHPAYVSLAKDLYKESFIQVHEDDPYYAFFERQKLLKIPLIEDLSKRSIIYRYLKEYIKTEQINERTIKYIDLEDFLNKTRGSFNLKLIKEAPFFIS